MTDATPERLKPWYHRPEWIIAMVSVGGIVLGGAGALSQGSAQTTQNTRDIAELKSQFGGVPERLARIEQKVDDLTTIEKRRNSGTGD
jgi:hypothetical protein